MRNARISLTVLTRNEEQNLTACLASVAGLFDEVVVLDTGSQDRTREMAAALGARVFEVPWADSFAAARNTALDRATGAWAFRLDADERLDPADRDALGAVLAALPPAGVDAFSVRCVHGPGLELPEVRLFPNRPDVRWEYRVHEQIPPAVNAAGGIVHPVRVRLRHHGYTDPALTRRKLERNLRLLELDAIDRPDDPYVRFYAGWSRFDLGDAVGAVAALEHACKVAPAGFGLLAHCHAALARAHRAAGHPDRAREAVRTGRLACPHDAELVCLEAELLLAVGDRAGAAARFAELLAGRFTEDARPPGGGTVGYRSRHGLACGLPPERVAERERLWREVVALRPDFGPAWLGLGELLVANGRGGKLGRLAADAETARPGHPEPAVLRALRASAAGDHRGARRELERCRTKHPGTALPCAMLVRVLLLEGRDRGATVRAIADLRTLDPKHPDLGRFDTLLARWRG